ncbi:MAG: peptide chain release factor N(5)-glutamine methyltransferase [Gemmatimonadetes bacterium]|nr:peptide chain release factor N(5)-glutamine methyltransferase [Gemmatimonadota bacterium]
MSRGTAYTALALSRRAADRLGRAGLETPRLDAELLLAHVLGISRLDLYLQHDRPLTADEVSGYRAALRRRLQREPLQYITGEAYFRELVLRVDPRVLIPRPETEVLVGEVLAWARRRAAHPRPERETGVVGPRPAVPPSGGGGGEGLVGLELGTGSGAIALSLLREGPFARVVATDSSDAALAVAEENAARHGLLERLELRRGSLWQAVAEGEAFDAVVSNPPYVAESERETLAPEVREWEPVAALFAAEGGMAVLEAIVGGAAAHLRPGGLLALEVGLGQAAGVKRRVGETEAFGSARVVRDLAGRERIVMGEREPAGAASPLAKGGEKSHHA